MCVIDSDNAAKTGGGGPGCGGGGGEGEGGNARAETLLRIEPVDNWHSAWPRVLKFVERHGDRGRLQVDADGWLSARQVLMVAMVGDHVAAHVCFSVAPGRTCIEAKLDNYAIAPKFCGRGIESQLYRAARDRAESLGCEKLWGFTLSSTWC